MVDNRQASPRPICEMSAAKYNNFTQVTLLVFAEGLCADAGGDWIPLEGSDPCCHAKQTSSANPVASILTCRTVLDTATPPSVQNLFNNPSTAKSNAITAVAHRPVSNEPLPVSVANFQPDMMDVNKALPVRFTNCSCRWGKLTNVAGCQKSKQDLTQPTGPQP